MEKQEIPHFDPDRDTNLMTYLIPPVEEGLPELAGIGEAWEELLNNHDPTECTPHEMFALGYWAAIFAFTRAYNEDGSHGFSH